MKRNLALFGFILILMFIVATPIISAGEVKSYDAINKEVTIKSTFLGFETGEVAKVKLETPLIYYVVAGKDRKVAEFTMDLYSDYSNPLKQLDLYTKLGSKINREFTYKYKTIETYDVEVPIYKNICKDIEENKTIINRCTNEIIEYTKEQRTRDIWNVLDTNKITKGKITVGIFTEVKPGDYIEWVPTIFNNIRVEEWAVWTDALQVGLTNVYQFENATELMRGHQNITAGAASVEYLNCPVTLNGKCGGITADTRYMNISNSQGSVSQAWNLSNGNTRTLSFWVYKNYSIGTKQIQLWAIKGTSVGMLDLRAAAADSITLSTFYPIASGGIMEGYTQSYQQWTHVVLIVNGTNTTWYQNGTLQKLGTAGNYMSNSYATTTFGIKTFGNRGFDGYIDEVYLWNRTLTPTEVTDLYNGGVGIFYNATAAPAAPVVTLNSPANNTVFTNTTAVFNCSATSGIGVLNLTLIIDNKNNETILGGANQNLSIQASRVLTEGYHNWTCNASDGLTTTTPNLNWLEIHTISPTLNIFYPTGTIDYGYIGQNISFNFSASDLHIDSCYFVYNSVNRTINCSLNYSFILDLPKTLLLSANDSANNRNTTTTTWDYNVFENSRAYNMYSVSGSLETFTINFSTNAYSSLQFYYNNSLYNTSIFSYGAGNYVSTVNIIMPSVLAPVNKTFYWVINGINTTTSQQTISAIQLDNCSAFTNILLNYTMYDEDLQTILPNNNNMSTEIAINVYALDYSTLIAAASFNTSTNQTLVCYGNLSSTGYYMDVITSYVGGETYLTKFNNIQKRFINSSTSTIIVPLYDLLTTRGQEFLITYKDKNFLPQGNVLVDVTRKYISEGVFKTVEVGRTDTSGQTLVDLVLGDVIYTINFIQNGVVLASLQNVLAKCESITNGVCVLNMNSFSSNQLTTNFQYNNGLGVIQDFDETTRTITINFIVQGGGTSPVTLNVSKFDRFGNTTVCSDSLTSSSGSLSCIIPASFGNSTVISRVYNNNVLSSQVTFSMGSNLMDNDTSGSVAILAIMIVLTLSMMFIHDQRLILLGTFMGLMLAGVLMFINSGNLFSVGSAITYVLIAIVIVIWKINQKEERN